MCELHWKYQLLCNQYCISPKARLFLPFIFNVLPIYIMQRQLLHTQEMLYIYLNIMKLCKKWTCHHVSQCAANIIKAGQNMQWKLHFFIGYTNDKWSSSTVEINLKCLQHTLTIHMHMGKFNKFIFLKCQCIKRCSNINHKGMLSHSSRQFSANGIVFELYFNSLYLCTVHT